jgi:hypothetical protein
VPRDSSDHHRARALPQPRRPCRLAGERRPRRGGGPPLRDRARARGQCRLRAFSASGMGLYQGDAALPAALWTACQSPSGTLTRARKERRSSPCRAISRVTHASLGQTYAPRPSRRPTASMPPASACNGTSSCCGRRVAHPQHVRTLRLGIRRPLPSPGARADRRSASRESRCSGSACRTPSRRRSGRRARRRSRRPRMRSRPPPRRTRSRP